MAKMSLKAGDKVIAYIYVNGEKPRHEWLTIKGFSVIGVYFEEIPILHWHTERNWYGCGYYNDAFVIYVRYAWLISRAYIFEKVRLEKYSEITVIDPKAVAKPFNRSAAHRRFERFLYPMDGGYRARRYRGL